MSLINKLNIVIVGKLLWCKWNNTALCVLLQQHNLSVFLLNYYAAYKILDPDWPIMAFRCLLFWCYRLSLWSMPLAKEIKFSLVMSSITRTYTHTYRERENEIESDDLRLLATFFFSYFPPSDRQQWVYFVNLATPLLCRTPSASHAVFLMFVVRGFL